MRRTELRKRCFNNEFLIAWVEIDIKTKSLINGTKMRLLTVSLGLPKTNMD